MKIGFTGTQEGMTKSQLKRFTEVVSRFPPFQFHHGDCIGADKQAHDIVTKLGHPCVIHPPLNRKKRAFCKGEVLEPKPYLERNKDIVNTCGLLIACPKGQEEVRSGTWSTIRYAKGKKRIIIIYPNGSMVDHKVICVARIKEDQS